MKPYSYKRIIAYILDAFIVSILSYLITYFIPQNEDYKIAAKNYTNLLNSYTNQEVSKDEFLELSNDYIYEINKNSITATIVSTVIAIGYYVILAYFMDGQTLGKKMMKIRIVSNNRKKLTMNNFLLRALVMNSILLNIFGIIFVIGLNRNTYFKVNDIVTYIFGVIYIITFGMILFKEDRRGIHDYIANTKVVVIKDKVLEDEEELETNKDSKTKDAEIIGEKKLKM